MKRRDLIIKLESAGYKAERDGDHTIYEKEGKHPVYPALFHSNKDGSFTITFPDLPGRISEEKSLGNAMYKAQSALAQWIEYLTDKKQDVPTASNLQNILN